MVKEKRFYFTVEGVGDFPFDMLRYDTCWPARETDTPNIAPYRQRLEKRAIAICGLKNPTTGRWESFGWRVLEVKERTLG